MPLPKVLFPSGPHARAGHNGVDKNMEDSKHNTKDGRNGNKVLANRYQLGGKLGSGAFGTAFLVTDLKGNCERKVLKQIMVADMLPDDTVDAVREARLLAKLDHPSIVKFHDSFMDRDCFCIVTEYCEGGDLDAKIQIWKKSKRTFDESLITDWFIQLTTAIKYIHERRVLHRDLKSRNIFLKNNLIKLGDFGISRILMGTSDLATTFTGTPYYMSPEVLKHDGYNIKSDIWSLGCVLYELCTLEHAFQGQNLMAVMYKIVEGQQPRLPDHFNPNLAHLFSRMLEKDPVKRPTSVELLQEPFIQQKMEALHGKMSMSMKTSSSTKVAAEAEAIARALSPVKLKSLVQEDNLTPRQKMELRKKQSADQEAEKRKILAAKNFSERQERAKERKKQLARVIPPWVEEHPDVFSDPNFSITQPDSIPSDPAVNSEPIISMEISAKPALIPCEPQKMAWASPEVKSPELSKDSGVNSTIEPSMDISIKQLELTPDHVSGERKGLVSQPSEDAIPEDPLLAETHYSQYNDFESSESSLSEDEYEALLGCIEDALDLPNQATPDPEVPEDTTHDSISPFTPLARQKRIQLLRDQCTQIYGTAGFKRVYDYLITARYVNKIADEGVIMEGLRKIVTNIRDCFLIDQLVFLEKQAEVIT